MEEEQVAEAKGVVEAMAATEARLLLRLDLDGINPGSMPTCRLLQILRRREAGVVVVEEEGDVVGPIPIAAVVVLPLSKHRGRMSIDIRMDAKQVGVQEHWNTL